MPLQDIYSYAKELYKSIAIFKWYIICLQSIDHQYFIDSFTTALVLLSNNKWKHFFYHQNVKTQDSIML